MIYKYFLSIILLFSGLTFLPAQEVKLEKIWEVNQHLPTPESVLYDNNSERLYVSLIDGQGQDKDGKGGIAILKPDGTIENSKWVEGLDAPKGLALYKDKLYVADITKIVIVDIISSNIIDEIEVKGATFLNDVTVDDNGVVYVSDTRNNKIFELNSGEVSLYLDNVPSVNGLKFVNGKLLALAGKEFWEIDKDRRVTILAKGFEQGGDGLEPLGNGDYLVTCWPGLVYYVYDDGSIVKILDVMDKMNTADLGYNVNDNIIYIPTFNNNSVIAYKLN